MRGAPVGLVRGLSYVLLVAEWAVPVLVLIPVGRRITRGLATGLLAFYALVIGLFFSFGLYAWTLLAASFLLLPTETWETFEERFSPAKLRTVIYDVDCGICLWISRLCKRLDKRRELVFQGNDDIEQLNRRTADMKLEKVQMPQAVTAELVQSSVVVVDAKGNVYTRSAAIAELIRVLPFGSPIAVFLRLPGISQIANVFYDAFAKRRTRVSELCGMNACGIPLPEEPNAEEENVATPEVPSALRTLRFFTGFVREGLVLALFVAVLAQAAKENPLPFKLPQGPKLSAIVAWPRMLEKWNVLDVSAEEGVLVIDGQTRKATSIDPLTGLEPAVEADKLNARRLGQLWNDYLARIRLRENEPFQRGFRDYLAKGGLALEGKPAEESLTGFDAYWIRYAIATPGQSPMRTITGRDKIFMHSRGGRLGIDRMPLIKPDPTRRPE
jgi:predicted DCC family thiol-disulfide oxidoreductase YuxK